MSHITFKAEFSPELVDQSNDALGMTYNTQGPGHSKSNLPPPDEAGVNTGHYSPASLSPDSGSRTLTRLHADTWGRSYQCPRRCRCPCPCRIC